MSTNGHGPLCNLAVMPIYGKKHLKNLLLKNQESFEADVSSIASRTQGLHNLIMTIGWPLTFFTENGRICVPMHLYSE